jgi:hypothetical protein
MVFYHPGNLRWLRELLLDLLLQQTREKKRKKLKVKKTAQLNCASRNWTGTSQAHGKSQHKRIAGVYSSQLA